MWALGASSMCSPPILSSMAYVASSSYPPPRGIQKRRNLSSCLPFPVGAGHHLHHAHVSSPGQLLHRRSQLICHPVLGDFPEAVLCLLIGLSYSCPSTRFFCSGVPDAESRSPPGYSGHPQPAPLPDRPPKASPRRARIRRTIQRSRRNSSGISIPINPS